MKALRFSVGRALCAIAVAVSAGGAWALEAPSAAGSKMASDLGALGAAERTKERKSVVAEIRSYRVISVAGKEIFSDATDIRPGDVVEYRATFRNIDASAVTGTRALMPLPVGMVYEPSSARPAAGVKASAADGVFAPLPLMREVKTEQGRRLVEVPLEEYRAIAWDLGEIQPGKSVQVSARVRLPAPVSGVVPASATK